MADKDFQHFASRRHSSVCSDDSLDQSHRQIHIIVGVKLKLPSTFAIENPLIAVVSGIWTPGQIYQEYCDKLSIEPQPVKSTLLYQKSSCGFENPQVLPFFDKPIYHWENWGERNEAIMDGSRIVFVH